MWRVWYTQMMEINLIYVYEKIRRIINIDEHQTIISAEMKIKYYSFCINKYKHNTRSYLHTYIVNNNNNKKMHVKLLIFAFYVVAY